MVGDSPNRLILQNRVNSTRDVFHKLLTYSRIHVATLQRCNLLVSTSIIPHKRKGNGVSEAVGKEEGKRRQVERVSDGRKR